MTTTLHKDEILHALQDVKDPEIPTVSAVDLGVITNVEVVDNAVHIVMTPTFVGCPAIEYMQNDVKNRIQQMGVDEVTVEVDMTTPWSTNNVTEQGLEGLRKHGLALPQRFEGEFEPEILLNASCPFCQSTHTTLQSMFGPTLCRAIYYCNTCKQAFEQFKPV